MSKFLLHKTELCIVITFLPKLNLVNQTAPHIHNEWRTVWLTGYHPLYFSLNTASLVQKQINRETIRAVITQRTLLSCQSKRTAFVASSLTCISVASFFGTPFQVRFRPYSVIVPRQSGKSHISLVSFITRFVETGCVDAVYMQPLPTCPDLTSYVPCAPP